MMKCKRKGKKRNEIRNTNDAMEECEHESIIIVCVCLELEPNIKHLSVINEECLMLICRMHSPWNMNASSNLVAFTRQQ